MIATFPGCPVGTVVELGNPDGTMVLVIGCVHLPSVTAGRVVPVAVVGDEVDAAVVLFAQINERRKPTASCVARHGR